MSTLLCAMVSSVAAVVLIMVVRACRRSRIWSRADSLWVITCPETKASALVQLAKPGACGLLLGRGRVRMSDCSAWTAVPACRRTCLRHLELERTESRAWPIGARS